MGVNQSAISHGYISESDVEKFVQKSYFNKKQIYILAQKYRSIAHDSKISLEDFQKALEISNRSIAEILFRIIDSDGSGNISFPEFVQGLNQFHPDAPFEDKVKLCFNAYDADHGGTVSKDEITDVIQISLTDNPYVELSDAQIDDLVDNLIKTYDTSNTGELEYPEFYNMIHNAPGVIESFNLDLDHIFNEEETR